MAKKTGALESGRFWVQHLTPPHCKPFTSLKPVCLLLNQDDDSTYQKGCKEDRIELEVRGVGWGRVGEESQPRAWLPAVIVNRLTTAVTSPGIPSCEKQLKEFRMFSLRN